jgi:hypothetical protein
MCSFNIGKQAVSSHFFCQTGPSTAWCVVIRTPLSQVLVLHALRAENKQHRSYRLDRIVGARATTRTFVPSYAVELAPNTLLKWMKQPEFDAAYREACRLAFRQSVARLQQASGAAVSTLLKIMVDVNAPHSTRVRAADSVLDHAAKAIEIEEIEVRVSALEASVAGERAGGR